MGKLDADRELGALIVCKMQGHLDELRPGQGRGAEVEEALALKAYEACALCGVCRLWPTCAHAGAPWHARGTNTAVKQSVLQQIRTHHCSPS